MQSVFHSLGVAVIWHSASTVEVVWWPPDHVHQLEDSNLETQIANIVKELSTVLVF